jgi:hypothetical protein
MEHKKFDLEEKINDNISKKYWSHTKQKRNKIASTF